MSMTNAMQLGQVINGARRQRPSSGLLSGLLRVLLPRGVPEGGTGRTRAASPSLGRRRSADEDRDALVSRLYDAWLL